MKAYYILDHFIGINVQNIKIGESNLGVNPKVNNLVTSYTTCKNEIVWILDSNVHVNPDTLGRAVDCLVSRPSIGLVHHIPIGMNPESFGATVEQLYLNTSHAKVYTMINKLSLGSCVIGKSNIFRKKELEHVGGLAYFGKFMSEDNIIGQKMWANKRCHAIPADVVYQQLGNGRIQEYFSRRSRWTRIRKFTVFFATMIEPLMECMLNGVLGAYAFWVFWNVNPIRFYVGHVVYWFIVDVLFGFAVEKSMVVDNFPRFVVAWLVREVTAFPVLLYACAGSRVEWRGRSFKLKRDGTVVPHSMEDCKEETSGGGSSVVVDSIGKVLCSSKISVSSKIFGVGAVLMAVCLFLGAVVAEGVKGVLGIGLLIEARNATQSSLVGTPRLPGITKNDTADMATVVPASVQIRRRSGRVAAAAERDSPLKLKKSSCMDAKFASVATDSDSALEDLVKNLPALPRKVHHLPQRTKMPLWESAASYVSGRNFSTPPSASEAWRTMFGSLADRLSGSQHQHQ
ncbi:UNVERIFIED_CONTAM: hypothetical protein HDU68_012059 [Siphonaria sp. JEL0065]|nr:hypothetical protein HDU68_012059 [Siphonaria sp. JEL0065]